MKTLVYINPDSFVDVDLMVLRYLATAFTLVWYPVYYTDRPIYYTPEQMQEYALLYGIELHLSPRQYRQRDPRNLRFYSAIVEDINARHADIVYSCICEELYWNLARLKLKAKYVLGLHDVVSHHFSNPLKRFIQTGIKEMAIRSTQHVCVFSDNQRQLFAKRYGRDAYQLGLCTRSLGSSAQDLPALEDGVRLLFFGGIIEYKGLDLLIQALEKLREQGVRNLQLTIAGNGNHWEHCKVYLKTPGMYRLLVRFIDNTEIPDLMSTHHFLVLPYRNATQSGPLMLALGYGLPVLAPNYGCFKEYCDNESAILFEDLEDALTEAARISPDRYDQLRQNTRLRGILFTPERIAQRYIDCFQRIINGQTP